MSRNRSMYKDVNDGARLKRGRQPHIGTNAYYEFGQHIPFFFTRDHAEHLGMYGMYRGGSAFLIASGPSFKNANQDLLRQPGVWTMTINNAVSSFRGNAGIIVDEPQRFNMSLFLDPKIQKFIPIDHFDRQLWDNRLVSDVDGQPVQMWELSQLKAGDCPNTIGFRRNEKFHAERYMTEDTINWGNHADICVCGKGQRGRRGDACPSCGRKDAFGSRSVMLAALRVLFLLGFRDVYLVGVDFEMTEDKRYHFDEARHKGAVNNNNNTYAKLKIWLGQLRPLFEEANYFIYNTNPDSKLDVFDKMTLEEAVARATAHIGDPAHERTNGMYADVPTKNAAGLPRDPNTLVQPTSMPTFTATPAAENLPPVPPEVQTDIAKNLPPLPTPQPSSSPPTATPLLEPQKTP